MKKVTVVLMLLVLTLSVSVPNALAVDGDKVALSRELMALTDVPKMMGKVFESVRQSHLEKLDELDYPGKSPERDVILRKRVEEYLNKSLGWGVFEPGYTQVYSDFFTEDELQQAVDFYKSSAARKLIGSDLILKRQLLEASQIQMKDMAIKSKQIEREFIAEMARGQVK
jgi:hypothetical protein